MLKPARMARLGTLVTALATVAVLSLAGCSSSSGGTPADTHTTLAAKGCGSVPQLGANDPDGLLKSLSTDLQDGYNAYSIKVQKSAWADWKSTKTGGYTAAIVGQAPAAPYIATFQSQLLKSLQAQGIKVVANLAPNDPTDVPGQIQMFNQALSLKPDVIFFNPAAPEAAVGLVKQAHDAGIPVISTVVPLDSPYAISIANNSNLQAMETAAGILGAIGGKGTVLQVDGIPGIPPQLFWEDGIKNALKLCPNVSIAGHVQGLFQPPAAQQAVVQYLATNPAGVDAVFQAGSMGLAVRDAFQQAGMTVPPIQDINASQGMAAYANANPNYAYFGTATPPIPAAQVAAQVGAKVLAGAGPKMNQIVWAPYVVDRQNLSKVVNPNWSQSDGTDLTVDGVYLTDAQVAQFFDKPELGPQTAK